MPDQNLARDAAYNTAIVKFALRFLKSNLDDVGEDLRDALRAAGFHHHSPDASVLAALHGALADPADFEEDDDYA